MASAALRSCIYIKPERALRPVRFSVCRAGVADADARFSVFPYKKISVTGYSLRYGYRGLLM